MSEPVQQWHVKQEVAGQQRTLFSGPEHHVREYVRNNFPRPHAQQGQETARADVQVHGPDGSVSEYHGVDAVGANEDGFVVLNEGTPTTVTTDEDEVAE